MSAEVILLSDVTASHGAIFARYAAPYVLATHLESAGFRTVVIDYFTKHPDFFSYLKNF